MVVTLLFWLREGMRDYDHNEPPQLLPAVVHTRPAAGRPHAGPVDPAVPRRARHGGAARGPRDGWLGPDPLVVFLVWTLLGWLVDFTAEYRKVEEADRTGHLENIPAKRFPARTLQVFAVLFALVAMWQVGIFPPTAPATAGDGTGSPAPSERGGAPPGSIPLTAVGLAFEEKTLEAPAGQPFTIFLMNKDPRARRTTSRSGGPTVSRSSSSRRRTAASRWPTRTTPSRRATTPSSARSTRSRR